MSNKKLVTPVSEIEQSLAAQYLDRSPSQREPMLVTPGLIDNLRDLTAKLAAVKVGKDTTLQAKRAQTLLTEALIKGLISGLDPVSLAMWVDVSHWNGKVNVPQMAAGGVSGIMTKAADGKQVQTGNAWDVATYVDDTFSANVQGAYDAGIACIPYFYFQPTLPLAGSPDADWQYKGLKYAVRNMVPGKSFHAMAIDLEEKGETDPNTQGRLMQFYAWMANDPQFRTVPILIYTSMGWLGSFPGCRDWLSMKGNSKELWLAQWVFWSGKMGRVKTTWDEIRTKYLPQMNYKVITPGFADWRVTQFAQAFYGMDGAGDGEIDLNLWHGTQAQCYSWLGFTPKNGGTTPGGDPGAGSGDNGGDTGTNTELKAAIEALTLRMAALEVKQSATAATIKDAGSRLAQ